VTGLKRQQALAIGRVLKQQSNEQTCRTGGERMQMTWRFSCATSLVTAAHADPGAVPNRRIGGAEYCVCPVGGSAQIP
jgi:hypothetical protein